MPWPRDDERPGCPLLLWPCRMHRNWLSGPAWPRDFANAMAARLTHRQSCKRGGRGCQRIAGDDRYEDHLARGLASIINVLDPDVIVLGGGGLSKISRLYINVPAIWANMCFPGCKVNTRLVPCLAMRPGRGVAIYKQFRVGEHPCRKLLP